MIDTHCHLTFPDYAGRVDAVLADAAAAGVRGAITISTTSVDCLDALRLAEAHPNVWCSSGVHPLYADRGPHDWGTIERVLRRDRCVAWGELGLDQHYREPARDVQLATLGEQLEVIRRVRASGVDKPIVVHCREAFEALVPILRESGIPGERFVFHCFTGFPPDMRLLLDFGAMVSFTGVLTYKNAAGVREAAALAPMDRVMVETDAPFLTPAPHRGVRPNEPRYVVHTAAALAEIKGVPPAELERITDDNARRFFAIDF
jgi:TatD DNase family protein